MYYFGNVRDAHGGSKAMYELHLEAVKKWKQASAFGGVPKLSCAYHELGYHIRRTKDNAFPEM